MIARGRERERPDNVKSTKSVSPATTMTATRSDRPTSRPTQSFPHQPLRRRYIFSRHSRRRRRRAPCVSRKNSLRFLLQVFFAFRGFSPACLLCNQIVTMVKFQAFCFDAIWICGKAMFHEGRGMQIAMSDPFGHSDLSW